MSIKVLLLLTGLAAVNAGLLSGLATVDSGRLSFKNKSYYGCKVHSPVCGVDGETYTNACMARARGEVSIRMISAEKLLLIMV